MKRYIAGSTFSNKIQSEIIGKIQSIPFDFRESYLEGMYIGFMKSSNSKLADFVAELLDIVMLNDASIESQNQAIRDWVESNVE